MDKIDKELSEINREELEKLTKDLIKIALRDVSDDLEDKFIKILFDDNQRNSMFKLLGLKGE